MAAKQAAKISVQGARNAAAATAVAARCGIGRSSTCHAAHPLTPLPEEGLPSYILL